jgi:hypothetical protein
VVEAVRGEKRFLDVADMGRSGAATLRIRKTALVEVHVAACYGVVLFSIFVFSNFDI